MPDTTTPQSTVKPPKRVFTYLQWARIVFFCLVIASPEMMNLAGLTFNTKQNEKRKLAPRPSLGCNYDSWLFFSKQYESYYLDQFNLWNSLIQGHNLFSYFILGVSLVDRVAIGKEGWLFYAKKQGNNPISDYRGLNCFQKNSWKMRSIV